jgi:hypothetical protein
VGKIFQSHHKNDQQPLRGSIFEEEEEEAEKHQSSNGREHVI